MTASLADLREVVPALSAKNQEFASSLLAQAARRPLSDKQLFWVNKLVEDARQPQARPAAVVGELTGILALFSKAREHLKYPAIVIDVPEIADQIRVSVCGPNSKTPGALNVQSYNHFTFGAFGEQREWYGRVGLDGTFTGSGRHAAKFGAIQAKLAAFAAEPARIASEYGLMTGRCCFCSIPLKDERSTAVGYGRTCAKHYGLPWG